MRPDQPCLLTTKDFAILEVMLGRCLGRDDPRRPIIAAKLATARVVLHEDIPAGVVTLNSRVRYRAGDGPAQTRVISHDEMHGLVGSILPIRQPRGLALLGLAEGQSFAVTQNNGQATAMTVLEVVYQPEAARHARSKLSGAYAAPRLRLVHDAGPLSPGTAARPPTNSDDPGPTAA
jgi:regulator of nucleoside diphosphate kinase